MKNSITGKSVLVSGGCGFIGSHLVEELIKFQPKKIIVADNLITGNINNIDEFVKNGFAEFVQGDLCDPKFCTYLVQDADIVFHQAALGSVPRSVANPLNTHANNATAFLNLIDASQRADVKKFIYASSSSVYGDDKHLPKKEEFIGKPISPYATSKLTNELYASVFSSYGKMCISGLRYFNVFGPRQPANGSYAAVIPGFIQRMIKNEEITIFGTGEQKRDFTYVKNVVKANIDVCNAPENLVNGEVFNVAAGGAHAVLELYEKLAAKLNYLKKPVFAASRLGDILNSYADISKSKQYFGFEPIISFDEGLNLSVDWFLKNG